MTIYRGPPAPPLPRQSIIHHLFPELSGGTPPVPADTVAQIDPGSPGSDSIGGGGSARPERRWTRGEVLSRAQRLASGLRGPQVGLKRGDVVGVIGMNSLEWLNSLYGSLCAGLRVSPINYAYTPPELLHQLSHSGVSLIFVDPALVPTLHKTLQLGKAQGFSVPEERIVLLCEKETARGEQHAYRCIDEVYGKEEWEVERFDGELADETCVMCYSSGTTGVAKGVETTHHNFTSQLASYPSSSYPLLSPTSDIILAYLPLSHMYSFTLLVLHTLVSGVPMVVLPRFEEVAVLRCIERYAITFMLVVPPVLITFANSQKLGEYRLGSLRAVMSAAAPLSEELCVRVEGRLPGLVVTQAYGLTEISPLSHILPLASARGRQSSIGQLCSTYEARLVDTETGRDVPPNTPGELWLRSPSVMKGYYKNADATRGTFSKEGGWFRTGDQARRDEGGYYYIEDRLKELIKYKGFQVAPAELEAVLLTHPNVADCAVIGVYVEEQATELPRAYVVPQGGLSAIAPKDRQKWAEEVQAWIKGQVANHKQLRGGVELVQVIPKSPAGKILRKNLRAALKEQQAREKSSGVKAEAKAKAKL